MVKNTDRRGPSGVVGDAAVVITDPRSWLEGHLDSVTKIVTAVARRRRIPPQEQEELLSLFLIHIVKDDYRVLRTFRGRSALHSYLTTVADRLLLDSRISVWGKWRPSARARRLGHSAVLLERMVLRDGQPLESVQKRLTQTGRAICGEFVSELARRSPSRRREFVELDEVRSYPTPTTDPWTALLDKFHATKGRNVGKRLDRVLRRLPAGDQVLVRMRHEQGLRVSQIATMLRVDPKKLYRRLEAIHADIRAALAREGIVAHDALDIISEPVSHVPPVLRSLGQVS